MILDGNEKKHTLYEWCLVNNIEILDLEDTDYDQYMLEKIDVNEFKTIIDEFDIKTNSTAIKPEKYLELRMYGFVPYNISPIQKGIQFDHAKDDYKKKYGDDENFKIFMQEWLTTVILDGGTSNEGHLVRHGFKEEIYYGTMQGYLSDLEANKVKVGTFYEPDLNSMLSGIVFLVDERVFNKKLYPDYVSPILEGDTVEALESWGQNNSTLYNKWLERIGGPKNEFLRNLLLGKKLA